MIMKIHGVTIEFSDDVDVQVDGDKVSVRAKSGKVENHYHTHIYPTPFIGSPIFPQPVIVPFVPPVYPYITGGSTSASGCCPTITGVFMSGGLPSTGTFGPFDQSSHTIGGSN